MTMMGMDAEQFDRAVVNLNSQVLQLSQVLVEVLEQGHCTELRWLEMHNRIDELRALASRLPYKSNVRPRRRRAITELNGD